MVIFDFCFSVIGMTPRTVVETLWRNIPEAARECFEESHLTAMVSALSLEPAEEIRATCAAFMKRIRQVNHLRGLDYAPQRSEEWLNQRKNLLTASDLASALNKGKFCTRSALLKKKAEARRPAAPVPEEAPPPVTAGLPAFKSPALAWGTMFEPMIARIYSEMNNDIELYEFGLVQHPTLTCFGASPDGITELGRMLEIKCPWRRVIEPGVVPEQYMLQIQGQLAVCGLDECDYLEVVMEDIPDEETYYRLVDAKETHAHGVIVELQASKEQSSNDQHYEYSPPKLTPKKAYQWAKKNIQKWIAQDPTINIMRIRPWKMKAMNLVPVAFDGTLWDSLVPLIRQFWADVEEKTLDVPVAPTTTTAGADEPKVTRPRKQKKFSYRDDDDA